jgi:iron(III) transport system permease protein
VTRTAPAAAKALPTGARSRRVRRASPTLWILALVAVAPSAVPLGLLAWSAIRGGPTAGGFSPSRLAELMGSTTLLVVAVTATTTVLGVTTAWITTRTNLPGRRTWGTLAILPIVIPSYVGALALLGASGNDGVLSLLTTSLGMPALPPFRGFWAAWVALTLWNYPFVHLLVVPVLRRMDPALEEAARGLGSSRRDTFRTIVIPQLRPSLAAASLLVSLYTLSDFGAVSLLGYETFTRAIYTQFRGRLDIGPALFLSGLLMFAALVLVVIQRRVRGRLSYHSDKPKRPPRIVTLSRSQRLAAWAVLGATVSGALLLPAGVLTWWAVRGLILGIDLGSVLAETLRAGLAASLAAAVTVLAAIPVAILTVRHRSSLAAGLESMTWATYSLPHLAVGLGFLVFALRVVPVAYQSLPLLVIAYTAVFLPQALGAAQAALRQVGTHLEEASRTLGRSPATTFRRIVLPLITPGLMAGGALVFLTTMKELPTTLMLRPTGFETLAVRIWSSASEGLYTRASVAALVLLAVSALPLYTLVTRDLE